MGSKKHRKESFLRQGIEISLLGLALLGLLALLGQIQKTQKTSASYAGKNESLFPKPSPEVGR